MAPRGIESDQTGLITNERMLAMHHESPSSTAANADLWTSYLHSEWSRWTRKGEQPGIFGQAAPSAIDTIAGQVAAYLTLVAAGPLAWLYLNSARPA